jgi:pimeloyl-ACP methyl ester carboxylesterase
MNERSTRAGEFTPPDTFVLHPYGRYCNAFKFAGEIDVLEALEAVMAEYPIDRARVVLRGFSMGGAGVWHLATHYADQWVCAAPGAGFAETARYLRLKPDSVPEIERTLWQWYDATDYALNLFDCPTVAYSGELDKQRQAADVMETALRAEGLPLIHLIGARTEHRYQPETKRLLSTIVDALAAQGKAMEPEEIRFTTRTLRYPKMHWLILLGLEKHWSRADVRARLTGNSVKVVTTNVSSFALQFSAETLKRMSMVEINGTTLQIPKMTPSAEFLIFSQTNHSWAAGGSLFAQFTKGIGHQGPIDDAFMDRFVFVPPSSASFHQATGDWIESEFKRAVFEWRAQFRGDVRVMNHRDAVDMTNTANLILWGDPQSNPLLARILPRLPMKWTADHIEFGGKSYNSKTHVALLIFPNPLNPEKYVVLNSGFTFRGFGSNADQTPKLPDYALIDVTKGNPFENGISAAGFFDEIWELKGNSGDNP